jgi:cyclophilin family peptidyl-prolyl cis-trans isomerase
MVRAVKLLFVALALPFLSSCHGAKSGASADAAPSASTSSSAPAPSRGGALARIETAEQRRASDQITPDDLKSRDVLVRRHAARALGRIADGAAHTLLLSALRDEDAGVVAWAAYGLGFACKGQESATVHALVARAASLTVEPARDEPKGPLDAFASVADALGRCGNAEAEATLRGWLEVDERADAAALALGRMASRTKRLDDASIVALLDAATRPDKPVGSALFAFTRLTRLGDAVEARLFDVAKDALSAPASDRRSFAVRALGRAGPDAVAELGRVLGSDAFTAAERADAARELAKLGASGQTALRQGLTALEPKPDKLDALASSAWGPLITTLEALTPPARDAKPMLDRIAELEPPKRAVLARRVIRLRCRAAVLLAGESPGFQKLTSCDPDSEGVTGALAMIEVLGRGKITGARFRRWKALSESKKPLVRQAAIEIMAAHPEIPGTASLLAHALRAPDAGSVVAAAQVISAYPARAAERPPEPAKQETADAAPEPLPKSLKPLPAVVDALTSAFAVQRPPDAIEVWSALMEAAASLQLLSFKPKLETFCKSDNPTLREHAEKSLHVLGEAKQSCKASGAGKTPPELSHAPPPEATLTFQTDAGELQIVLDSSLAPVTVERVIELARSGFFDGVAMHRVVPGFVVQFGDPGGDGYGGAGREPLRCETSPLPFEALRVGVALAGRDTGSSQLFVTLGPFPHLDGDYPLIGRAKPGWERVARGDVIQKVRVVP